MRLLALFLLLAVCLPVYAAQELILATGSEKGTYFPMGKDIKRIADDPAISIKVLSTGGSVDNIEKLRNKEAQFGIVQFDILMLQDSEMKKSSGKSIFDTVKPIMPLHKEEIHLVASAETDVEFGNKQSYNICAGEKGSGSAVTAQILEQIYNIKLVQFAAPYSECLDMVKKKQVDFMVYTAGKPVAMLREIKGYRLLSMPANTLGDKYFLRSELTRDDYTWNENTAPTYASGSVLVTNMGTSKMDEVFLSAFLLRLYSNVERLKRVGHPKWNDVVVKDNFGAFTHPVAAWLLKCFRYDDEKGFTCE